MNTRICTKCLHEYPATTEYFKPEKRVKSGLQAWCRVCSNAQKAERDTTPEGKQKHADYQRAWRAANRKRARAIVTNWRKRHPDQVREKKRRANARNPKANRARAARWYYANLDRARAYRREYRKDYDQSHADQRRAHVRNRRARLRAATGTHTAADVKRQYQSQRGKCYWCGRPVGTSYHVDHVIPVSRGGSNDPANLVIACAG